MKSLGVLLLWLVCRTSAIAAEPYTLDAAHSQLIFRIRQYVSVVTGKFTDFTGTVNFDSARPESSRVEAKISVKSIDTGIAARDHHLLAADFFDAEKYPTMSFRSNSVHTIGEQAADVHGELTMHGKTQPVVIHVELLSPAKSASDTLSWKVTAHLRRSEFGLRWNPVIEAASGISDDIEIQMRITTPAHPG
jgi:polyisoprenoid-binding protein YceI